MERIGEKVLPLAKMVLPGDIRQRTLSPHVQRLAQSIDQLGPINCPTVRKDGSRYVLLAGRDRVAAHIILQRPEVRCVVVRCTDQEAIMLELAENAHRRNVDIAEMDELCRRIDEAREKQLTEPDMPKSKKSRQARAVERIAKEAGVDAKLLRREWRKRADRAEAEEEKPIEVKLQDIGMPLDDGFKEKVGQIQRRAMAARDFAVKVKAMLHSMAVLPVPNIHRRKAEELAAELTGLCERLFPAALCPYCKGVAGVQETCALCHMQGWIPQAVIETVPDKFWDRVDRIVMVAGRPERLSDLIRGDK